MLSGVAFALAGRGWPVVVITSRQRYDAPRESLPPQEVVQGVTVHRVWTSRFGRTSLLGRSFDYATFYLSAAWTIWRLARAGDVVVAKTDPPVLSIVAAPICYVRRAHLVNWLQDIFPETAEALRVGGPIARVPYALLRRLRNWSLGVARRNVVLGERMATRLERLGVRREQIEQIPNWADGGTIVPVSREDNPLRSLWSLGDAFIVGYSGNLGRAHEIDTLIEAMSVVAKTSATPVLWLFVGGGALIERLKAEAARRGLDCVRFEPYQPRELLAQSLSAADVHLASLRPELEGLIVPSKFYGIAAAGRPCLFIGDADGEIARLLERHQCGLTVATGDGAGLAEAVLALAANRSECRLLGERARRAFEAELDLPIAVERWDRLSRELAADQGKTPPRARADDPSEEQPKRSQAAAGR